MLFIFHDNVLSSFTNQMCIECASMPPNDDDDDDDAAKHPERDDRMDLLRLLFIRVVLRVHFSSISRLRSACASIAPEHLNQLTKLFICAVAFCRTVK